MNAKPHRIVFEGLTVADLVRQCKAFIGESEPVQRQTFGTASVMNTWPVPSWAPKGSKWFATSAPPTLHGPDGSIVPVRWSSGTAQKPPPKS